MAAYATVQDVEKRVGRLFETKELLQCQSLLEDSAAIIDAYNASADENSKRIVSVRMVVRAMGAGDGQEVPIGATQGSMSALGYSQSWTIGTGGSVGELYIGRLEKKILGIAGQIGSYSPTQELIPPEVF